MSERFQPTSNFGQGGLIGGYSSEDADDALTPTQIVARFDPVTKRMLVDIGAGGSAGTQYEDGETTPATPVGTGIVFDDAGTIKFVSSAEPLPVLASIDTTGLATSAKQDTIIGHVDGIETTLTAMAADVARLDNASSPATVYPYMWDGGAFVGFSGDAGNGLDVDVTRSALPTGAATSANQTTIIGHVDGIEALLTTIDGRVDGIEALIGTTNTNTGNTATALQIMDDWDNGASDGASVSGDVAHDTADAGEPVKIGYKAIALSANPTAVTANDRTNAYSNRHGIPFVLGGHPNILTTQLNITDADGAQSNVALITVGAGAKIVVTAIDVMADGANTVDVGVRIGFGTANTPANDAAGSVLSHPGIKAGSGISKGNGTGILGIGADNEDLRITCEDPVTGAIDVLITYFTIES